MSHFFFLLIDFVDELVIGINEAAWPLIRSDLGLTNIQIGLALNNISGLFGNLLPFGIGVVAQVYGLQWAMWLLLAGPNSLFIGIPHQVNLLDEKTPD